MPDSILVFHGFFLMRKRSIRDGAKHMIFMARALSQGCAGLLDFCFLSSQMEILPVKTVLSQMPLFWRTVGCPFPA